MAAAEATSAQGPNIVFLLADDLGYGDLACYGCADIRTPAVDGLAAEGVRFTTAYSSGPECSPTRTAFLTGRYQQRVGGLECALGIGNVGRYDDAIRLRETDDLGLPAEETSIARTLKDAGYATGLFGKWHLGYADKFSPNRHGFDQALYAIGGGMDYFHHVEDPPQNWPALFENERPVRRKGYYTNVTAAEAVGFIRAHKQEPFFLYVPFTAPHAPFQGPGDELPHPLTVDSPLRNQGKGPAGVYAAMVESMDAAVGRVMKCLDEEGLAQNTLVVFASDNGGTASARPTPFRGIKGSTFEGGIRVPCIARWPGVLRPGTVSDEPTVTMDLSLSFLHAAGTRPSRPFDGVDILERVRTGAAPAQRSLFWRGRRGENTWRGVRDGSLKYVSRTQGAAFQEYLFDLDGDAGEKNDLLAARPADAARLKRLLAEWEHEVRPVR